MCIPKISESTKKCFFLSLASWQKLSNGYVKKVVWHWFLVTNEYAKNIVSKVMFFLIKYICHFVSIEHLTIGFMFLNKAKLSLLARRTIAFIVFICIIWLFEDVRPGNVIESYKKHSFWKKYWLSYYSKQVQIKI